MIIQRKNLSEEQLPFPSVDILPKDAVFFDIETTGLSHRVSHLYQIGAVFYRDGRWQLIQWFLQKPSEEPEVLRQFSDFLKGYRRVIHYNGQSFDIPYLQDRYGHWELEDPFSGESAPESLDLFREFRSYKSFLKLESLRQKDIEAFLCFPRKDEKDGKELIDVYHSYLKTAGSTELELLLLHNHDDIMGMLTIYAFYNYMKELPHDLSVESFSISDHFLEIMLTGRGGIPSVSPDTDLILDRRILPKSHPESYRIRLENTHIHLQIEGICGCFRHYYPNYKDYFYLPLEDTAIHKSVGIYVDPSCREKAKADTCYTRKDGLFFFQPSSSIQPDFHLETRKSPAWFSADQLSELSEEQLTFYLSELIQFLLHTKQE